ncbi:MAG: hypothetical protein N3C60_01055 [Calditerrivibrio sp.]|nr:hypothetical protein [Calditerrivibrio sp.]
MVRIFLLIIIFSVTIIDVSYSANNYCSVPPYLPGNAPPLIMLILSKDHKMFYEAYNDAVDLDDDGKIEITYKHSFNYYGYFDPKKCYKYDSTKDHFYFHKNADSQKYCDGSSWSGNLLNWLTMSRMDIIRKVLYGGYRSTDTATETILEATFIPRDAHSWGKRLTALDNASKLIPYSNPTGNNSHLFCITSTSDGQTRKIRFLNNTSLNIWDWASKERPVCDDRTGVQDFFIRVKVCDETVGLEENCKQYPNGKYKPIGILQKYGEGDYVKVCSKNFQICSNDNDCTNNGKCISRSDIFFGLITGSYEKNMSGGVVRKNISSVADEINQTDGTFKTSVNGIINTLNKLRIVGFNYSNNEYDGGWKTDGPMTEGTFRSWGNPIGEMLYEGLRYFADKGTATSAYSFSSSTTENNLGLPFNITWDKPYDLFPNCAKPFFVILSDINVSFDNDQLPGSYFNSFSGDLSDLNVSSIADIIGTEESIAGNKWFIGQSGSVTDTVCSSKSVTNLSSIMGICPEEPTKKGTYYSAAVAYYGKKDFKNKTGKPNNVESFVLATSDYVGNLSFKVNNREIRIIPVAKSISGCLNVKTNCYDKCTFDNSSGNMKILSCQSSGFCPTNQIVDYYITNIEYENDGSVKKIDLRVNFEDVEQGADHDMDAIVLYNIEKTTNGIRVKVTSEYAAGCIDQVLGFSISGTTEDGIYLVVRDKDATSDSDTPPIIGNMPLVWQKDFTVSFTNTGNTLRPPLWYVAKWGNFDDYDKTGKPDKQDKWDKDGDGIPDAYYEAFNGAKLADSLDSILQKILNVSGAGTGVALLTERTSSASIAMQGVYSAKKEFENKKSLDWLGNVYGWWTYAYSGADNSTEISIREDTVNDKKLNLLDDYVLEYKYQNESGLIKLIIDKKLDSDGDGDADILMNTSEGFDNVTPIWDSGYILLTTNPNNRKIFTHTYNTSTYNTTSQYDFIKANKSNFSSLMGVTSGIVDNLTDYVRGIDIPGWRQRTVTYKGATGVWKLGDIIHSKPVLVKYDTNTFSDYNVLYVGANDGMLHAFRVGKTKNLQNETNKDIAELCNDSNVSPCSKNNIGTELWAFIPRNVIPYLKYLKDNDYCHTYFVDLPPYIIDEGEKKILIGGLRLGGGCSCDKKDSTDVCTPAETDGLSSYFAIDISNPTNPVVLWEFSDVDLGFSYSGPAYIKRPEGRYIMFGNGPTHYKGKSTKGLKYFILSLTSDYKINSVYKTTNNQLNMNTAFSGKLFTEGIDLNNDGYTDFVAVGYVDASSSTNSGGGVLLIQTKSDAPSKWDFNKSYLNVAQNAITSKITSGSCFGRPYLFFGSGRHFYAGDSEGTPGNNDENYIWGIPFDCTIQDGCKGTINAAHSITLTDNPCKALQDNSTNINAKTAGWKYALDKTNTPVAGYLREKVLIDPVLYKDQVVLFVSTKYATDPCTMEATSKIWMLNCATGRSINISNNNPVCTGYQVTVEPKGIAVDTSGGMSVLNTKLVSDTKGYYTSPVGIVDITVDENLGIGNILRRGRILFWIEK